MPPKEVCRNWYIRALDVNSKLPRESKFPPGVMEISSFDGELVAYQSVRAFSTIGCFIYFCCI